MCRITAKLEINSYKRRIFLIFITSFCYIILSGLLNSLGGVMTILDGIAAVFVVGIGILMLFFMDGSLLNFSNYLTSMLSMERQMALASSRKLSSLSPLINKDSLSSRPFSTECHHGQTVQVPSAGQLFTSVLPSPLKPLVISSNSFSDSTKLNTSGGKPISVHDKMLDAGDMCLTGRNSAIKQDIADALYSPPIPINQGDIDKFRSASGDEKLFLRELANRFDVICADLQDIKVKQAKMDSDLQDLKTKQYKSDKANL